MNEPTHEPDRTHAPLGVWLLSLALPLAAFFLDLKLARDHLAGQPLLWTRHVGAPHRHMERLAAFARLLWSEIVPWRRF